jgi:phosphoenolpyruvate phosphomutase / 2-hydroxyethylphosphonate cytidylyltransferase
MIHSRQKTADEVFEFARRFRQDFPSVPLVSVPTSYNLTTEAMLAEHGFNIVIYANQLLRAAYPAMEKVARMILENGRSAEADKELMDINTILELIPGTR